jgi:Cdc6-like AAA superfamily ATPase
MSKIYFIVGTPGTGTTIVATNLMNAYRENNQIVSLRTIGIPERIIDSGTKEAAETLDKISLMLDESTTSISDATIFMGWRVPDHINEIYLAYPSATFIFTDNSLDDPERRIMFEKFVSSQLMSAIIARQKTTIDSFIATNSLTLSYQRVNTSVFNTDRSLNLDIAGTIAIAVLGSI